MNLGRFRYLAQQIIPEKQVSDQLIICFKASKVNIILLNI